MFNAVFLTPECFTTSRDMTRKWLLTSVDSLVTQEVITSGKPLETSAAVAKEWQISSVTFLVALEVISLWKCSGANVALERPFTSMGSPMHLKAGCISE